MAYRISIFLCFLCLLAGCSTPAAVRTQPPAAVQLPAATLPPVPSRVVTLSNETPLPKTATASPAVTVPAGINVTLKGDDFVNLRGGPSPRYPIVGRVTNGTSLVALARSEHGEWLLLAFPNAPGGLAWVYAAYTDYDAARNPLPAATPSQPLQ